jgi:Response regulator receiver domain
MRAVSGCAVTVSHCTQCQCSCLIECVLRLNSSFHFHLYTLTGGSYGIENCGGDAPSGSEFWFSVAYCPVTDSINSSGAAAAAAPPAEAPAAAAAAGELTSYSTAALLSSAAPSVRSSGASSAATAVAAAANGDAPGSGVLTAANSRAAQLLTVRASPALSLAESEATAAAVAALLESPAQHSYNSSSCGSSGSSVRRLSNAAAAQQQQYASDPMGASWHNNPPMLRLQSSSSSASASASANASASTGLLLVTVEQPQSAPSRAGSRRSSFSNGVMSSSSNSGTPRLRLPDAAAATAAATAMTTAANSSSLQQLSPLPAVHHLQAPSPPSVLVVDDEPSIRTFLCRMFVKRGFVVAQAADGLEGLQIMKSQAYDAVLMDLNMYAFIIITTWHHRYC